MLRDQDLISLQEVRTKVEQAWSAWQQFRRYNQQQLDAIVERMGEVGRAHAVEVAELAVSETGMGNVPDKTAKNLLNADLLPKAIRGMKTTGILRELPDEHLVEVGEPVGVIAAILPTTNPTSTAIYKAIIALKAGNAIVMSPHPRARQCTARTAALMNQAAVEAGAPDGLVQCAENPTLESTTALMKHEKVALILSTGGSGIVRAAYSSGKPAFGVGPGNVPVLVDESADLKDAVRKVVSGKSFDYGTVCSSEQTLVAVASLRTNILSELKSNRAYLCTAEQSTALARTLFSHGTTVSSKCVGQSPQVIARLAGFEIPPDTSILCAEIQGYGREHPLSAEKLSPVLALLFVPDHEAALQACEGILRFGGLGHTCVIHARDEARVREFGLRMPAFRVLVNTGSPQGSTGITTGVLPSMTLGCGAIAGNITGDNVGPQHLINTKRIAWGFREVEDVLQLPQSAGKSTPPPKPVVHDTVMAAVEQYLVARGLRLNDVIASTQPKAPSGSDGSAAGSYGCACKGKTASANVEEPAPAAFVSEADVRAAIADKRTITIGPKTIVTPAARDLASVGGILVSAKRS
jgi:acyl-CoA reductase-like NAD-dependent aldehyde dehydrogenase